ncbi:MAG: adenylate/guanylate cyclase domain-containing protein [Candidatus Korobacteraceae bacterium]
MRFWKIPAKWFSQHAHLTIALAATAIGLILFVFAGIGENGKAGFVFLQDIEQRSLDLRFALRGSRPPDPRIVIVGIDEKTLQEIGSYPLPRSTYAALIRNLKADGARVIAFDMTFTLPESSQALSMLSGLKKEFGPKATPAQQKAMEDLRQRADVDAQFANAIKDAGNIVLGHLFLGADRAKYADPKQAEAYFNIVWAKAFPQVFKDKSGKKDFDLGNAWIQAGGPVAEGVESNLPQFAEAAASYGFFNINPDDDGTLRRALYMIRYRDQDFFPSLDLEVLQQYENIPDQQVAAYISADGLDHIQFGSHDLRPRTDGTALINYVGPYHSYPHYSMADVLNGKLPADTFRDKIVFVGSTALGIGDLRNTPFQQTGYMGVEVHANILDNLLHDSEPHRTFLVRSFRQELVDIGFIILFGAGLGIWFGRCRPFAATVTAIVVLAAFSGFVYFAFAHWGRWFSFVIPATTLVISYVSATSFRVVFEEREKRRIRSSFSQYLSPGVISLIEKDPEKYIHPGGETRELSMLFSDIRGFTNISEGMTPDALVHMLNEYFTAMTQVLNRNLGTLDKYVGDAIVAFWGSPYPQEMHAFYACRCAVEMIARLEDLNRDWEARGILPIAIGIGINSGDVSVGNIGSEHRLAWTVIGDNVNLASRLEGLNKQYRTQIMISEATYVQVKQRFIAREVDKIRVKGKKQPVTIYELLGPLSEQRKYESLLTAYNSALASYRAGDWREAAGKFGPIMATHPLDGPTQELLQRCLEFMEEPPPEGWDFVYEMHSK